MSTFTVEQGSFFDKITILSLASKFVCLLQVLSNLPSSFRLLILAFLSFNTIWNCKEKQGNNINKVIAYYFIDVQSHLLYKWEAELEKRASPWPLVYMQDSMLTGCYGMLNDEIRSKLTQTGWFDCFCTRSMGRAHSPCISLDMSVLTTKFLQLFHVQKR